MKRAVFLPACLLFLCSCSGSADRLRLLEANLLVSRGEYLSAVSLYSRAAAKAEFEAYASYGLGLTYLALGEIDPALKQFQRAADRADAAGPDAELAYRARFNAGIARYRSGDLPGAAEEFKRALRLDGSRIEAKRNLELCLKGVERRRSPPSSSSPLGARKESTEPKALFDYIREKESDRWRSREWSAESANTPDY